MRLIIKNSILNLNFARNSLRIKNLKLLRHFAPPAFRASTSLC